MRWILLVVAVALIAQTPVNAPTGLTVTVDGQALGTFTSLVFTSGNGIVWSYTPNGSTLNLAAGENSATVLTRQRLQSNACQFIDAAGGPVYSYSLGASCTALTAYQRGMSFALAVGTQCVGACTLNVDNLGPKALKQADGTTDASFQAGRFYWIVYDGTVFRVV